MVEPPSAVALGSLLYQTVWVVAVTFLAWFALIQRYSASRLSAFTFLTPLFGVAAGHVVLGDPLTPAFALAAVAAGGGPGAGEPATLTQAVQSGTSRSFFRRADAHFNPEGAGKCDNRLERLVDPTERKALERKGAHK